MLSCLQARICGIVTGLTLVLPSVPQPQQFAPHGLVRIENALQTEIRLIVEDVYGPPMRRLPGLDIGRAYRGASDDFRYGGDMVDVFHYGNGWTSLAVVDITGHGIRAAANAGLVKHALRAYASSGLDARDSVRALNRLCIESSTFEGDDEFFATVFFAIVPADRRTMQYVSAGHEAAYLIAGESARVLAATGPLVGLMDADGEFDHGVVPLRAGDIVAAVTDGFSESRSANLEFLGSDAVVGVIQSDATRDAEQLAEALTWFAFDYAGGRLHDDVAALVLKSAP
ncbi:MAG: PP2C family protein-serine/threonine phosphatase [Candidatus Velthaea sp.]